MDVLGIPIPDAGPVFLVALSLHVVAGLACVSCGVVAMLTRRTGARHRRYGRAYLWGLAVVFATMSVMSAIRWRENAHLFGLGVLAVAAACIGYLDRRGRQRDRVHIAAMGLSYVVLLTAFYVDNGPHLPLWEHLPAWTFWVLPALAGFPLIVRAIRTRERPS
ncbi:DUF2306 domain-containing protein [Nonomuraea phyllanthi]|uniref:DUF2306 domain-containing protein n=1 Tax=Nonomuraea phyllanthi TaxID=2219224 RepID=UPI001884F251|nr:DUF2306 domain-containing protein [Nonomuraea phyllanthi]